MGKDNIKICLIYSGIPNPDTGGGSLTIFSLSKTLKEMENKVFAVLIVPEEEMTLENKKRLENYQLMADECYLVLRKPERVSIFGKFMNKFSSSIKNVYPEFGYSSKVKEIVEGISPDVALAYHFPALAASYGIKTVPKMAIVGDPPFLAMKQRFLFFLRQFNLKYFLLFPFYPLLYLRLKKISLALLNEFGKKGAFSFFHAKQLGALGIQDCKYYRTLVRDPLAGEDAVVRSGNKKDFKILLLGHLKGIATLTGISLFAEKILPVLRKEIGENNFKVDIVGKYFDELPKNLKKKLSFELVKPKGFIKSISREVLSSDVVLVPTPIKLGIRVRIITAMAYGKCVVTHLANKSGIPELENGFNCLIGSSGEELAEKIIDCYRGKYNLEEIGLNARKTFKKYFEAGQAIKAVFNDLKFLCSKN